MLMTRQRSVARTLMLSILLLAALALGLVTYLAHTRPLKEPPVGAKLVWLVPQSDLAHIWTPQRHATVGAGSGPSREPFG